MKIIEIRMIYDWKDIDAENDNINVFVEADDRYNYTLSLATVKNIQFLMDKEKMDYYGPGYPFIIVNKLTPEIIEKTVKAFAEEGEEDTGDWLKDFIEGAFADEEFVQNKTDLAYWLKVYPFEGWQGAIKESIFDQLKTTHLAERKEIWGDAPNDMSIFNELKSKRIEEGEELNGLDRLNGLDGLDE